MKVPYKSRLASILALVIPVFIVSIPVDAGNRGAGGAADKGQNGDRKTWQTKQGTKSSAAGTPKSGQQKHQMQSQTRSKKTIRHTLRDDDIYGHRMMTSREMQNSRARLDAAPNDREWVRLRAEHQQQMMQRADERGVALDPPVYGRHMLSREERQRFERQMAAATSAEERNRIREEHRSTIQQRARELDLEMPPYEGG